MEQSKTVQLWVGIFVAIGIASIFMMAMKVSNISSLSVADGYEVIAHFDNIGGLKVRSPVTMAGVVVGRVDDISYDSTVYEALVKMKIENRFANIPKDSSAGIFTSGLLGEQYIGLDPGGADAFLKQGDEFKLTQSAVVLEKLIGQFLMGKADEK